MAEAPRCLIVSVRFKVPPSDDERGRVRDALGFTEESGAPYAGWQTNDRTEAIVVATTEPPGVYLGSRRRALEATGLVENFWAIEATSVAAYRRGDDPLVQAFEIADAFRRVIEREAQQEAERKRAEMARRTARVLSHVRPVKVSRRGDPEDRS